MKNLHKLYYQDYYKNINFTVLSNVYTDEEKKQINKSNTEEIKEKNKDLIDQNYKSDDFNIQSCKQLTPHTFPAKVQYPGVVTGIGLQHEAGIEGELKLGFHFDFTYGLPVIYGSTVKGVLRSYFEDYASKNYNLSKENISELILDIFEGKKPECKNNENTNKEKIHYKSIYERDVFFDAVIIQPNTKKRILDSDTICPHGDNPLRNPKPINFLKVSPGVTFEFRFKLVDSQIGDIEIKSDKKLELFKKIILEMGVGAKTNVGYGQFVAV